MKAARDAYPVPNALNLVVLFCSLSVGLVSLSFASNAYRSGNWYGIMSYALLFSFVNNTTFSLLHESVHGVMNSNRKLNDSIGWVTAAFFPTTFTLQQIFHLGHHCRNRTVAEMFDLYYPHDNVPLKRLVIYSMPTGFYWLSVVAGNVVFLTSPWLFKLKIVRNSSFMKYSSFDAMLSGIPESRTIITKIRQQILLTIVIQGCIFYFLDIAPFVWLCCYWFFGMNWGSLQYSNHAFSKRDIRHGAWNLRVNPLVRLLFLNYHCHLAHHQHPYVPWIYLPAFVEKDEERPFFWVNLLKLIGGPYPVSEPPPTQADGFDKVIYEGTSITRPVPDHGERAADFQSVAASE